MHKVSESAVELISLHDYGQVADRLDASEATVRRMIDKGLIRSVAVSPIVRFAIDGHPLTTAGW
jgi:hypothetical protein